MSTVGKRQEYFDFVCGYASQSSKFKDVAIRKAEIFEDILIDRSTPILSVGMGVVALGLALKGYDIAVCQGTAESARISTDLGVNITYLDDPIGTPSLKYDTVIAADEFTTYADTEAHQLEIIEQLCRMSSRQLITTVKDYKNMSSHRRNFEEPFMFLTDDNESMLFMDQYMWDRKDRQHWDHHFYAIKDHSNLETIGPISRRTMYFKQLAKFTSDMGGKNFTVHKEQLYKSVFKKTFEHVISVQF